MRNLLLLLACLSAAPAWGADPLAAGRTAFQRCQLPPGRAGTQLELAAGIVGRRAGAAGRYSPAMKKAGFVWDEKRLAAFLRDPDAVVPGNKMRFWGLRSRRGRSPTCWPTCARRG